MLRMSYSKRKEQWRTYWASFRIIWTIFVHKFLLSIILVGGCNFAQLTAWALYFDRAALQAVHYFAEKWKLSVYYM